MKGIILKILAALLADACALYVGDAIEEILVLRFTDA